MSSIGFDSGVSDNWNAIDQEDADMGAAMTAMEDTAGDYSTSLGETVGGFLESAGDSFGEIVAGAGNGIAGLIGGGREAADAIARALGINPNRMGSTIMTGLAQNLIGGHTNTSGLTSAQLTNLLKSTTFQNATPAQQAQYVRVMQQGNADLRTGRSSGLSDNEILDSRGSAALGSGSGALGSTPGIGSFGADSANGNAKEALRNFMLMKGMDAGDVDKAISNPDPSVRMAMWGQMMTYNEQNQKAWFDTLSNLIKIYGEMASNINGKMGQI